MLVFSDYQKEKKKKQWCVTKFDTNSDHLHLYTTSDEQGKRLEVQCE